MADNLQSRLDVLINGQDNLSPKLQKIESKVIRFVGAVSASLAALKAISFPVISAVNFEREMANVAKTTNFSSEQIDRLSKKILDLSLQLSVSAEDLAKVAAAAGQQGLGREGVQGILSFTESVARMANVLDLTAEDAANSVGKIANIFKVPLQDLERVVASFNQTSNNTTASGEELLDVVRRIGNASGSLRVDQTVGLAASAIDFGVSPEVAGSNLSRAFATMLSKADDFAQRMKISTADWTNEVQKDGIGAFKKVLSYLRTLTPNEQQKAIGKLFGGGARGGSLINKYVQDANDYVLNRDLAQAGKGYEEGISALREQATVQATVKEQGKLLFNSIYKDAVEAGNQITGVLIKDIRDLRLALQEPATQNFINAAVGALGDVLQVITGTIRYMAGLNINWQNFITLAKVFVSIKLAETFTGLLGKLPGVDTAIRKLSVTMQENAAVAGKTGKVAADAAEAEVSAWAKTKASLATIRELRQRDAQAVRAQAEAQVALAQAEAEANALATAEEGAFVRQARANTVSNGRSERVTQETAKLKSLYIAQGDDIIQLNAELDAKMLAAEVKSQQARVAIETEYEAKVAAAKKLGRNKASQEALADAEAFLANSIKREEQRYTRSIAGLRTYYDQQMTIAAQAHDAMIAEQEVFLSRIQAQEGAAHARSTAANEAFYARQQAAAAAAGSAQEARVALEAATGATTRTTSAMTYLALGVNLVKNGIAALARVFVTGFFWVTIIYQLADAFGLLKYVPKLFQSLTDAIGLTSEASRKMAQQQATDNAKLLERNKLIEKQVEALNKLKDANTGTFSADSRKSLVTGATSTDQGQRNTALDNLAAAATGSIAEQSRLQNAVTKAGGDSAEKAKQALVDLRAELDKNTKHYDDLVKQQKFYEESLQTSLPSSVLAEYGSRLDRIKVQIIDAQRAIEQNNADIASKTLEASGAVSSALGKANDTTKNLSDATSALFSEQSAQVAEKYFGTIADSYDRVAESQKAYQQAQDALATSLKGNDEAATAKAQEDANKAEKAYRQALTDLDAARSQIRDEINKMLEQGNITDEKTRNSLSYLNLMTDKSAEFLRGILNALNIAKKLGIQLNASAQTVNLATPTSGTAAADETTQGQRNQQAKARIKLAEAEATAEVNLNKEKNQQILDAEQNMYSKGLIALRRYFGDRQKFQLQDNNAEIAARRRELQEIQLEIDNLEGDKNSAAALNLQAQATQIRGQIAVLQEQQKGIRQRTQEDLDNATLAFNDRVKQETVRAFSAMQLPGDLKAQFKASLDEQLAQYRVFLAQLETESQAAMAQGDAVTAQRLQTLANALRAAATSDAFDAAIQNSNGKIQEYSTTIEQYQRNLEILRGEGAITAMEAEAAYNATIEKQLPLLQKQLAAQQELLAQQDPTSAGYTKMAQEVEDTRLRIAELGVQANATARSINQGLTDSIANAFNNLEPKFSSLKKTVISFIGDIANQLKQRFAQNFAEDISRAIGSAGAGGFGGYFQSVLQKNQAPAQTNNALILDQNGFGSGGTAQGAGLFGSLGKLFGFGGTSQQQPGAPGAVGALGQPGSNPANPLYTRDASSIFGGKDLFGLGGGDKKDKGLADLAGTLTSSFSDNTDKQIEANTRVSMDGTQTVAGGVNVVAGAVNGNTSQIIGGLITLGTQIVTALAYQTTANAVSSAHTGGVIGRTSLRSRRFSPAIFNGAQRFHTGGVVGLGPDEVPIIAKKNEEMLTQNDPRHRANGGLAGGAGGGMPALQQTLVFDTQAAAKAILTPNNLVTAIKPNVKALRSLLGVKDG